MNKEGIAHFSIGVVIVAIFGVIIYFVIQDQNEWEDWCHSQNGHVKSNTHMVTTVDYKGKPAVGSETTYYCLSSDGKILDIK